QFTCTLRIPLIPYTTLFRSNLRTSGELSQEVQVYNFYDDIRQKKPKFLLKKPFNNAEEKGFIKFKVNNHPHDSYRYYKDGYYRIDRKSTRLNSSHVSIPYTV